MTRRCNHVAAEYIEISYDGGLCSKNKGPAGHRQGMPVACISPPQVPCFVRHLKNILYYVYDVYAARDLPR
jgi:hypothetical protein